jgi:hypothetical protein
LNLSISSPAGASAAAYLKHARSGLKLQHPAKAFISMRCSTIRAGLLTAQRSAQLSFMAL